MESERHIEKLLRAWAKKRRDETGGPFDLHPATRRLLQGQVTRQFAKDQQQRRWMFELFVRLRPRVVWGAALIVVLALASLWLPTLTRNKSRASLDKHELAVRRTADVMSPQPTVPSAARPVANEGLTKAKDTDPAPSTMVAGAAASRGIHFEGEYVVADSASALRDLPPAQASSSIAAEAPAARVQTNTRPSLASDATLAAAAKPQPADQFLNRPGSNTGEVELALKSPVAAGLSPSVAPVPTASDNILRFYADKLKETREPGTSGGRRFTRVELPSTTTASAGKSQAAQPVLSSFEVEQTAQQLRIVDADGSIYTGSVQLAGARPRLRSAEAQQIAVGESSQGRLGPTSAIAFDAAGEPGQIYSFRVTGTNRTLNQSVVFTGSLTAMTNAAAFGQVTSNLGATGGRSQLPSAPPTLLPLVNSRISGKAIIGRSTEVEINAVPTVP